MTMTQGFLKAALGLSVLLATGSLIASDDTKSPQVEETVKVDTQRSALLDAVRHVPVDGATCLYLAQSEVAGDQRTREVRTFLRSHSCPIDNHAAEFVLAADLNQLDYRLLPTLAVLETGCGRLTKNNNLFGWANGRKPFASIEQAIHHVAQRLRLAPHYAGKNTRQKLQAYNRRATYRAKVLRMMDTMEDPSDIDASQGSW